MITTGANSISKIMMVNHSLQELLMSENNIGDDGISAIAGALGNCKISLLNHCNITLHLQQLYHPITLLENYG